MRACIVADPALGRYLEEEGEAPGESPDGSLSFFVLGEAACRGTWKPPRADLYVLPAPLLLDLGDGAPIPAFAYGPVSLMAELLRGGATDYLRSPWTMEELRARACRLESPRFRLGEGLFKVAAGALASGGRQADLTESECRILRLLAANLGRPVPRSALALSLWGKEVEASRAVDVHVSCLRKKLEALLPGSGQAIEACRGQGYRLVGTACG
jgi:DNA-binding winged helix-turn-helix (wHTH) protein